MDFRVLGPLEVHNGEAPIGLGGAKQRALLALAGSGLRFEPRGEHDLAGLPGTFTLLAVTG
jgi:hypothetical protein